MHVRACYRICRVYLPIIVDGPDAFLFALSVEPVVLFIYLFSWSCSPPEHDHIPQFDECGIEQDFGSNVSYVIQRWYVYELEDIAVAKYLHPLPHRCTFLTIDAGDLTIVLPFSGDVTSIFTVFPLPFGVRC